MTSSYFFTVFGDWSRVGTHRSSTNSRNVIFDGSTWVPSRTSRIRSATQLLPSRFVGKPRRRNWRRRSSSVTSPRQSGHLGGGASPSDQAFQPQLLAHSQRGCSPASYTAHHVPLGAFVTDPRIGPP